MPFVYPSVIRFSQVDAAGILFFSRALEICHEAYEHFLLDRGMPISDQFSSTDWVLPVVHADVDFHAPLRLGDHVQVQLGVTQVGTASITLEFRLVRGGDTRCATVRHVHAAVDRASFQSRPLPGSVRDWGEVTF